MDVTKTEAARSQLVTAIKLYFDDNDPVSVHTLAAAAGELIGQLCRSRNIPSMRDEILALVLPTKRKEIVDALNKSQNFFKHASYRRPNKVLRDFSDDQNLYAILLATDGLRRLGVTTIETAVFTAWVSLVVPELTIQKPPQELVATFFGDMANEARGRQKEAGRDALKIGAAGTSK